MDKILRASLLFDFYGELLTDKQKTVYEMYFLNDLSLHEIAEEFCISRQAVFDLIKRTESILNHYEEKLLLLSKYEEEKQKNSEALECIDSLINKHKSDNFLCLKLSELKNLLITADS